MARANVDPTELRRFAKELARFHHDLETMMGSLHARARDLATSWRDQEQRRFTGELEQAMRGLKRFLDTTEEHAAFLNKKASLVEDYLKR